ncbi:HrpJ domain-containing protein [Paludibacterium purpuratum]|uniref:Type III secretion system YopN/LcrE/InvE/MxiC family regulator n=1 Tax=Paludibacterium purpuratum TaxID=1144873 RepID=A0A4R7B1K0_9NEIS|nr:HrpJ domain-containing protein [Paludibacterium purpuratum]TDR76591.1 type III secretion system YopN/LcrE/InvE/MxiC family regulator [Paludibacterium purpuratum]
MVDPIIPQNSSAHIGANSPVVSIAGPGHAGESVFSHAAAALEALQSDLSETGEDVGFALGSRRGGDAAHRRNRVTAWKLVAELGASEEAVLDGLLTDAQGWLQAASPRAALELLTQDRGRQALLLAAALARGKLSPQQKTRLEEALSALLAEEDMALAVFGALHGGVRTPDLRQALRRLYQRAGDTRSKLSEWLAELGERETRRQKLAAMIQVLAFELSASGEPIVGSHLVAVIGDLQRLLNLLGLESHCQESAHRLACPDVDGEWLLNAVVRLSEQLWADAELVAQMLPMTEPTWRYPLIRTLSQLIQVMPARCFVDDEHQARLLSALAELRDRHAD